MTIEKRRKDYLKIILRLNNPTFSDIKREITKKYDIVDMTIHRDLTKLEEDNEIIKEKKKYFFNQDKIENLELFRAFYEKKFKEDIKIGVINIDNILEDSKKSLKGLNKRDVKMMINSLEEFNKKQEDYFDRVLIEKLKERKLLDKYKDSDLTIKEVCEKEGINLPNVLESKYCVNLREYLVLKTKVLTLLMELYENFSLNFSEYFITKYPGQARKKDQIKKDLIQARIEKTENLLTKAYINAIISENFEKDYIEHLKEEIMEFLDVKLKKLRKLIPFKFRYILQSLFEIKE